LKKVRIDSDKRCPVIRKAELARLIVFLSILLVVSCSSAPLKIESTDLSPDDPVFKALVAKIDGLAAALDGNREKGPEEITRKTYRKDSWFYCWASMSISGRTETGYRFRFDEELNLLLFQPHLLSPTIEGGMGYDTFKDTEVRERIMRTIREFSKIISFRFYGGPFIRLAKEWDDSYYLVSFYSVPEEALKKHRYVDPYITFFVTKDMRVFGIFRGA